MATMPVVAGVDGSEESLRAVEWAALEARRHRAPLRIVSVADLLPRMRCHPRGPEAVAVRLQGESGRALEEAITRSREIAPGQLIDVDLLTGPPAVAVTQSGSGALMLVVGARGSGGFAAMALGSVSRYAAMHARCPVVVIREETSAVHREVVVGVRDPLDADDTLGYAFDEAALRGATLIAVHSWNLSHPALSDRGDATRQPADAEHLAAEAGLDLAEALKTWHDKYPAVTVWQDVVHDHPAHVLASYSVRADLVVIGRHVDAGSRCVIGGIQHALLTHARGPVAIVPDGC
jgi:nucleotide-binding universal stress UspA family protein